MWTPPVGCCRTPLCASKAQRSTSIKKFFQLFSWAVSNNGLHCTPHGTLETVHSALCLLVIRSLRRGWTAGASLGSSCPLQTGYGGRWKDRRWWLTPLRFAVVSYTPLGSSLVIFTFYFYHLSGNKRWHIWGGGAHRTSNGKALTFGTSEATGGPAVWRYAFSQRAIR